MKKILLTLAYDGTNYFGYQLQNDKPTVALMLNIATKDAFGFEILFRNVSESSRFYVHFKVQPKRKILPIEEEKVFVEGIQFRVIIVQIFKVPFVPKLFCRTL